MRLLIVLDNLGFKGGAHVATFEMIRALASCGVKVELLTTSDIDNEGSWPTLAVTIHNFPNAFPRVGFRSLVQRFLRRVLRLRVYPDWTVDPDGRMRHIMSGFDVVLVVGENSELRKIVRDSSAPRKIVFIHTDYVAWRLQSSYSRVCSRLDGWLYKKYDLIGVVGRACANRFVSVYPEFGEKTVPFRNIVRVNTSTVLRPENNTCFTIVSLARPVWGAPKNTELSVKVAARLKAMGLVFKWIVYGEGCSVDIARIRNLISDLDVEGCFSLPGFTYNPQDEVRKADVTVLLSSYEGMSNAIFESLILGTPVIATDVGCASEQIEDGKTGRVVGYDEDKIVEALAEVMHNPETVVRWRRNLSGYKYENDLVIKEYLQILNG